MNFLLVTLLPSSVGLGLHLPGRYASESEASREVANLTERKNLHPPVYVVKEYIFIGFTKNVLHKGA